MGAVAPPSLSLVLNARAPCRKMMWDLVEAQVDLHGYLNVRRAPPVRPLRAPLTVLPCASSPPTCPTG